LTEHVRHALARHISATFTGDDNTISIITLDHEVEEAILDSVRLTDRVVAQPSSSER
jgi:flagellar biosynthesis protein FlhA